MNDDTRCLNAPPPPLGQLVEKVAFRGGESVIWDDTPTRSVADPGAEAQEGTDEPTQWYGNDDEVGVGDFSKLIEAGPVTDGSETFNSLHKCGAHLLKAKCQHMNGDYDECGKSINKAMVHWSRVHQAMKAVDAD